jgi:hypothetical protein
VRVQEVRLYRGGTEQAGEYTLLYVKGNEDHELGICSVHMGIISAVKTIELVNDRKTYIIVKRSLV